MLQFTVIWSQTIRHKQTICHTPLRNAFDTENMPNAHLILEIRVTQNGTVDDFPLPKIITMHVEPCRHFFKNFRSYRKSRIHVSWVLVCDKWKCGHCYNTYPYAKDVNMRSMCMIVCMYVCIYVVLFSIFGQIFNKIFQPGAQSCF